MVLVQIRGDLAGRKKANGGLPQEVNPTQPHPRNLGEAAERIKLTHSHGKISRDSRQSQNMNLQIIIRKLKGQWLLRCSALLGVMVLEINPANEYK
jgi:hypothetical protein